MPQPIKVCLDVKFVFGRFTDLISATLIEVSPVRKMTKQRAELPRDWISDVSSSIVCVYFRAPAQDMRPKKPPV